MIITGGTGFSICGVNFAVSTSVPGAPTITSVTTGAKGSGQMTVSYTAPVYTGYPAGHISGYTLISRPGCIAVSTSTGASGSLTITCLTNGTPYLFKMYATNCQGNGPLGYYCTGSIVQPPTYTVSYLIVAGGGGGGAGAVGDGGGGGGGAGGVLQSTTCIPVGGSYPIVIGAGGGTSNSGTNSTALGLSAIGGGRGGSTYCIGGSGGSGGGCSGGSPSVGGWSELGAPGTPGQGHNGGYSDNPSCSTYNGGGGGGGGASRSGGHGGQFERGTPGHLSVYYWGGGGGTGTSITTITTCSAITYKIGQYITATNTVLVGGGGGGGGTVSSCNIITAAGGPGGGGSGGLGVVTSPKSTFVGGSGLATTGGGGGGGADGCSAISGGSGGSGAVVISYSSSTQRATGGTVTSWCVAGTTHWAHIFTASGTFLS